MVWKLALKNHLSKRLASKVFSQERLKDLDLHHQKRTLCLNRAAHLASFGYSHLCQYPQPKKRPRTRRCSVARPKTPSTTMNTPSLPFLYGLPESSKKSSSLKSTYSRIWKRLGGQPCSTNELQLHLRPTKTNSSSSIARTPSHK